MGSVSNMTVGEIAKDRASRLLKFQMKALGVDCDTSWADGFTEACLERGLVPIIALASWEEFFEKTAAAFKDD